MAVQKTHTESTTQHFPVRTQTYSGYRAETGQVSRGFSTHRHVKSGEAGEWRGGLSVHQACSAYRSIQRGEAMLLSPQRLGAHRGSSTCMWNIGCLWNRDDSVLRKYTAHLHNRPREAEEGGVLLPVQRQRPLCRAQAAGWDKARLLSWFVEYILVCWGRQGRPSPLLAHMCWEILPQAPPAFPSSHSPSISQASTWTPMTSSTMQGKELGAQAGFSSGWCKQE